MDVLDGTSYYRKDSGKSYRVMFAVVVVLVTFLVAYMTWRHQYRAVPNCNKGTAESQNMCKMFTDLCDSGHGSSSDAKGCVNAVAHCIPFYDRLAAAQSSSGQGVAAKNAAVLAALASPGLKSCTRAVSRVDPAYVAKLATALDRNACVPSEMSTLFSNDSDYHALLNVTQAGAPLLPYAVRVARKMPVCSAS
jgi:hypothetical protein